MFCSHWLNLDHSVAPPALLCHKEPAQGTQSLLLGTFFWLPLVLYVIRAPIIDPFRAWKPPLCHKEPAKGKYTYLGALGAYGWFCKRADIATL